MAEKLPSLEEERADSICASSIREGERDEEEEREAATVMFGGGGAMGVNAEAVLE